MYVFWSMNATVVIVEPMLVQSKKEKSSSVCTKQIKSDAKIG